MSNEETIKSTENSKQVHSQKEVLDNLRKRIMKENPKTLKEEYGSPMKGSETGLDDAFIISRAKRDELIKEDRNSAKLLKPYWTEEDIERWYVEPQERWLIRVLPGKVNIDEYPAIKKYLKQFKPQLEKRSGNQKWFELPADYFSDDTLKIAYKKNSDWATFMLDIDGGHYSPSTYYYRDGDYYLMGLLNSKLYWWLLEGFTPRNAKGAMNIDPEHLDKLPMPMPLPEDKGVVGQLSDYCQRMVAERNALYRYVQMEIAKHLSKNGDINELSEALKRWHILSSEDFFSEVKRVWGHDLDEENKQMWKNFLNESQYQLNLVNSDLVRSEMKLNARVYRIFELTEEEIEHLERI